MVLDGDLLRYAGGKPVEQPSSVESALQQLAGKLRLSQRELRRDLLLEKTAAFGQSPTFSRLFALAEQQAGRPGLVPSVVVPSSPFLGHAAAPLDAPLPPRQVHHVAPAVHPHAVNCQVC